MFRKTLIALAGVFTLGAAPLAIAQDLDGDANPVPGVSASGPATSFERSFAGPRQAASGISTQDTIRWARLSEVH